MLPTFYGTFPRSSPLYRCFVMVTAHDVWSARELMSHWYRSQWAEVYDESRLPELLSAGMTQIELGQMTVQATPSTPSEHEAQP